MYKVKNNISKSCFYCKIKNSNYKGEIIMKINLKKLVLNGEAISHKIISVDECCDEFVDSIRYGYCNLQFRAKSPLL